MITTTEEWSLARKTLNPLSFTLSLSQTHKHTHTNTHTHVIRIFIYNYLLPAWRTTNDNNNNMLEWGKSAFWGLFNQSRRIGTPHKIPFPLWFFLDFSKATTFFFQVTWHVHIFESEAYVAAASHVASETPPPHPPPTLKKTAFRLWVCIAVD